MPGHSTNFHFPERAVMLFMENEIADYAMTNECEVIGQFISITKVFPVYKTVHKGVELAICQAPLGGTASTQIMEQLIAGGVKKVIATGCCGALFADITSAMYVNKKQVPTVNYVYGIGGRDTTTKDIEKVYNDLNKVAQTNDVENPYRYLGLRGEI